MSRGCLSWLESSSFHQSPTCRDNPTPESRGRRVDDKTLERRDRCLSGAIAISRGPSRLKYGLWSRLNSISTLFFRNCSSGAFLKVDMSPRRDGILSSALLLVANLLIPAATFIFATGFFPYKPLLSGLASYSAVTEYGDPPAAPFDKIVFMVIDALRRYRGCPVFCRRPLS